MFKIDITKLSICVVLTNLNRIQLSNRIIEVIGFKK